MVRSAEDYGAARERPPKRERCYHQRAVALGLAHGEQQFPPSKRPRPVPRFRVPAGTQCEVSPVSRLDWRQHTTVKDLGFERYESYRWSPQGMVYEFRHEQWLIVVNRRHVVHRADGY